MTSQDKNERDTWYQHNHGRWMTRTITQAMEIIEKHPGDNIYLYDRLPDGRITNIRPYWRNNASDTNIMPTITKGKVHHR